MPTHSQETLVFEVSPTAVVLSDETTRFVLDLQNTNWAAHTPASFASQGERIAQDLDVCILGGTQVASLELVVLGDDDHRVVFECSFTAADLVTASANSNSVLLEVRDTNDVIVFSTSIATGSMGTISGFSPSYVINSTLLAGESQQVRIDAPDSGEFFTTFTV